MGAKQTKITKTILDSIRRTDDRKPQAYDAQATVVRIEDGTAWVHIPGGVAETPVRLTINASVGDQVQVRVSGGRAFLVGNSTAPPTNDAYAKQVNRTLTQEITNTNTVVRGVQKVVQTVKKIADNTNQYFWHVETGTDTGAHITEIPQDEFLADPESGGGNLLARSNGIAVRDGLDELATFSASGLAVNSYDENGNPVEIAHLGYDTGAAIGGGTAVAPYTTLGQRAANTTIGNYSVAEGYDTEASGFASHAEGSGTKATRYYAHASGIGTIANQPGQTAVGWFNKAQSTNTLFEIGNGSADNDRSNAMTVDWNGNVDVSGTYRKGGYAFLVTQSYDLGVISIATAGTPGTTETRITTSITKSGYTPIAVAIRYADTTIIGFDPVISTDKATLYTRVIRRTTSASSPGYHAYADVTYIKT